VGDVYTFGPFVLDPADGRLLCDGEAVPLTPKAFDTLVALVTRPGRLVEKDELMKAVWPDAYVEEANLTVNISTIRKALGDRADQRYIETVPKRGYRFVAPVAVSTRNVATSPAALEQPPPRPTAADDSGRQHPTDPASGLDDRAISARASGAPAQSAEPALAQERTGVHGATSAEAAAPVEPVADLRAGRARPPSTLLAITTATAVLLVAVIFAIAGLSRHPAPVVPRDAVPVAEQGMVNLTRNIAEDTEPSYSPDGTSVAFASNREGRRDIYVMRIGAGEAPRRLTSHPGNDEQPAWSPDGTRIAFVSDRSGNDDLYVINVDGSGERRLTSNPANASRPAWSPDGTQIAYARQHPDDPDLFVIDVATGTERLLSKTPARREQPCWSRDGRRLAYTRGIAGENFDIYTIAVDGTDDRPVTSGPEDDHTPSWSPDGTRLAFSRTYASDARFQLVVATLATSGPVLFHVIDTNSRGVTAPAWSPDGVHLSFQNLVDGNWEIYQTRVEMGQPERLTFNLATDQEPSFSPDGQRVAFASNRDGRFEIYVLDRATTSITRLTHNDIDDTQPVWSPDGRRIAFMSERDAGDREIYVMNADGTDQRRLTRAAGNDAEPDWSPDSQRLVFNSFRDGNFEIYSMKADGTEQRNLTNNAARDTYPAWSPDGKHIIFASNRDSSYYWNELYEMDADGRNPRRLTFNDFWDAKPACSPDGTHIAFVRSILPQHQYDILLMDTNGRHEINLTAHPALDYYPRWSPDGRRIIFHSDRDGNYEIYTITVPAPAIAAPRTN
jgi:Tol biopolymer transport system component/DNA-binding winged helix-turn-helix (wHTH) protein